MKFLNKIAYASGYQKALREVEHELEKIDQAALYDKAKINGLTVWHQIAYERGGMFMTYELKNILAKLRSKND